MTNNESYLIIALTGERIEHKAPITVGTIVMAERRTLHEAETDCAHRNRLVRIGDAAHKGREYIVMSMSDYRAMERGQRFTGQ